MSAMASQIASLTIVYLTVYSGANQRKHQSSASLAFVRGIHRWPVNSSHKGPVTRKVFPFDDVIMSSANHGWPNDGYSQQTIYCFISYPLWLGPLVSTFVTFPNFLLIIITKVSTSNYCKIWIMNSHKAFEKSFYFFDDSLRNSTNLSFCSNSNHN